MCKQSIYCNYLDVGWYLAVTKILDTKGHYHFDSTLQEPGVRLSEVMSALQTPAELPLERQRALALCAVGTEFETEALHDLILGKAISEFDVFFVVACCYLRNEDFLGGMQDIVLSRSDLSVEEKIFGLQIFSMSDNRVKDLVVSIVNDLRGQTDFIVNNPEVMFWLFERNSKSNIHSEFFSLLEKIIRTVPDLDSANCGRLLQYGFNLLDVIRMVWCIRNKLAIFARGTQKTEKAGKLLKHELATHFRPWSESEKYLIKHTLKGKLNATITHVKNYEWYYHNVGFSLPELSFNNYSNEDAQNKIVDLDDYEKCLIAKYLKLPREEAIQFGVRFSDWHKDLYEYYNSIKPINSAHKFYELTDLDLNSIHDSDVCLVKVQQMEEFTQEEAQRVLPLIKSQSLKEYIRVIDKSGCIRELAPEDRTLYNKMRWSLNGCNDLSYDEYEKGFMKVINMPMLRACAVEFDIGVFESNDLWRIEAILESSAEDSLSILKLLAMVDIDFSVLQVFASSSSILTEYPRYLELRDRLDDETKTWLKLSSEQQGNWFRNWTNLSLSECYYNRQRVLDLFEYVGEIKSSCFNNPLYNAIMGDVIHDWVTKETPMETIYQKFGFSVPVSTEWVNAWVHYANKKFDNVRDIESMSLCYGIIDEHEYWLTNIGLISVDGVACEVGIPIWKIDSNGDEYLFELNQPLGCNGLKVSWLDKTIYSNTSAVIRLQKLK